jgi:hypothetical protein
MRSLLLLLSGALFALHSPAESGSVVRVDFSNPALTPAKWTLEIHPDGSGHFHSERGAVTETVQQGIEPATVDREIQLSAAFTQRAFETVHRQKLASDGCESHLKVAFQGWKRITYSGPEGEESCEFNYSKNRELQSLADSFVSVASTIIEGARLELLLHHDPLGLDHELEYLEEGTESGRLQEIGSIRPILEQLQDNPSVMERVRRRAKLLLTQSSK